MRTGEECLQGLVKMKPNVYVAGKKVRRDDPRIMPGVKFMQITYALAL